MSYYLALCPLSVTGLMGYPRYHMNKPLPPIALSRTLHAALIAIAGALAYSNTFHAPFYIDDLLFIVDYSPIQDLRTALGHFITGPRPVTMLSLSLNYAQGGYALPGYHIFNLCLHLLNALMLYALVGSTARRAGMPSADAALAAFVAALVFVLHPVHTQSVTYVIARSALLSTACYLGAMLLFARAVQNEAHRALALAAMSIVCLLGAGSKETFSTFIAMAALYDYVFLSGRSLRKMAGHWWAYVPVMLGVLYLGYLTTKTIAIPNKQELEILTYLTPMQYWLTELKVHVTYLRLLVLPTGLGFYYEYPVSIGLLEPATAMGAVVYGGLWLSGAWLSYRGHWTGFCILWFMVTLTPESSFIPLNPIYEHRLYLPSIGALGLVSAGVVWVSARRNMQAAVLAGGIMVALIFGVATYQRNAQWADPAKFWEANIQKTPQKMHIYNNLSNHYISIGDYESAVQVCRRALAIDPKSHGALHNLGISLMKLGKAGEAIAHLERAVQLRPKDYDMRLSLGEGYMRTGRPADALAQFTKTTEMAPLKPQGYYMTALAQSTLGRYGDGLRSIKAAIALDPKRAGLRVVAAKLLLSTGDRARAQQELDVALGLEPANAEAQKLKALLAAQR